MATYTSIGQSHAGYHACGSMYSYNATFRSNLARSGSQEKTLRIQSPLSEKHPWTTTLERSSFAVTRPQHLSLRFDLILPRRRFQAAYFSLWLVPLPAVSANCLMDGQTDKCKISTMMIGVIIGYVIYNIYGVAGSN